MNHGRNGNGRHADDPAAARRALPISGTGGGGTAAAARPLPDNRPYTLAAAYLAAREFGAARPVDDGRGGERWVVAGPTRLRHWREDFFAFEACVYRRMVTEELVSDVTLFLNDQTYLAAGEDVPLRVTRGLVADVVCQLRAICQVRAEAMPAWLTKEPRPEPDDVLAFENGLLSVQSWLDAPDAVSLFEPSPLWFSESVLPCAWSPAAECPRWRRFLDQALAGDGELIGLLQEFFGYCLTGSTRHQKLLWMHGVSGAGKSTVATVLRNVVGHRNCVSFELWDLVGRFTLSSFLGKRVAISADAALGHGTDADRILAKIKGITGEDPQLVDRKNRELLSGVLSVRLVISTNEFPNLPDAADALARRSLFVPFERSFAGDANPHLGDQLAEEVPGITVWALQGLASLIRRGRFPDAASSRHVLHEFRRLQSPAHAFVEDCCERQAYDERTRTGQTRTEDIYDAYRRWCKANERTVMSKERFCGRLKAAAPFAVRAKVGGEKSREYVYRNLVLRPEWVEVPDGPT